VAECFEDSTNTNVIEVTFEEFSKMGKALEDGTFMQDMDECVNADPTPEEIF
jgi:hypothetical protein